MMASNGVTRIELGAITTITGLINDRIVRKTKLTESIRSLSIKLMMSIRVKVRVRARPMDKVRAREGQRGIHHSKWLTKCIKTTAQATDDYV